MTGNPIDKFLDDPNLCEEKLSEEAGHDGFLETITKIMFPDLGGLGQYNTSLLRRYTFARYWRCFFLIYLILNLSLLIQIQWLRSIGISMIFHVFIFVGLSISGFNFQV